MELFVKLFINLSYMKVILRRFRKLLANRIVHEPVPLKTNEEVFVNNTIHYNNSRYQSS